MIIQENKENEKPLKEDLFNPDLLDLLLYSICCTMIKLIPEENNKDAYLYLKNTITITKVGNLKDKKDSIILERDAILKATSIKNEYKDSKKPSRN